MKQNPNSRANYGKAMESAYRNTKVFGTPDVKGAMKMKAPPMKKMSQEQIMKRRRSMISNAAHKVMNRNYSK